MVGEKVDVEPSVSGTRGGVAAGTARSAGGDPRPHVASMLTSSQKPLGCDHAGPRTHAPLGGFSFIDPSRSPECMKTRHQEARVIGRDH